MRTTLGPFLVLGAVAALTVGAVAIADKKQNAPEIDMERAGRAAVEAVGGGEAASFDRENERGASWEVEIIKPGGGRVEVLLDAGYRVVKVGAERRPKGQAGAVDATQPYLGPDARKASTAALASVGSGIAHDVDRSTTPGASWAVEIRKADGSEVVVLLDAGFNVLSTKGGRKRAR